VTGKGGWGSKTKKGPKTVAKEEQLLNWRGRVGRRQCGSEREQKEELNKFWWGGVTADDLAQWQKGKKTKNRPKKTT